MSIEELGFHRSRSDINQVNTIIKHIELAFKTTKNPQLL